MMNPVARLCLVAAFLAMIVNTAHSAEREPSLFRRDKSARVRTAQLDAAIPKYGQFVSMQVAVPPAPAVDEPYAQPLMTAPMPDSVGMTEQAPVASLFECVNYEDLHNVAPCAVTKVVAVMDPCQDPCSACSPGCVYVAICVPPCGCPEVKVSRHGSKVKYDYGKYEVGIESKNGVVFVDYDD